MAKIPRDAARDLTLLLIALNAWREQDGWRAWKGFDFDVLIQLASKGLVDDRPGRKSLWLTDAGIAEAQRLAADYGIDLPSLAPPEVPEQLQVLVELEELTPKVWRRLAVPLTASGLQLHRAIQAVFGWEDKHLHVFRVGDSRFGMLLRDEPDPGLERSRSLKLKTTWNAGIRELAYTYDFGDDWQCHIVLEQAGRGLAPQPWAALDGAEPAPPEDSGGPHGFADMRRRAARPKTADDRELAEWLRGFPPDAFDLTTLNARLRRMK